MEQIPLASEVNQNTETAETENPVAAEQVPELTEEEKQAKEAARTELVSKCRDYIHSYIERKAPGKIRYRANILNMTDSYVFRYSPPAKRGDRTDYFSQVVIDSDTNECRLEYFRPRRHDKNLWYFPIFYMMNGFTKNPARTFQALGLEPVQNSIRDVFESKGYRVKYLYSRRIGNVVCVQWGPEDQDNQAKNGTEPTKSEQPSQADNLEPTEGVPVAE